MVDFLKAFPFVTMEDYKWKLSVPMIRIMAMDNTHVNYLSDAEIKYKNGTSIDLSKDDKSLYNDFGVPILKDVSKDDENVLESK